jgi:hypothetical protein
VALVGLVAGTAAAGRVQDRPYFREGDTVSYDSKCTVTVTQVDARNGTADLMVTREDHTTRGIHLTTHQGDLPLDPGMIRDIVFRDAGSIWIISRLGRLRDGAVCLDLTTGEITAGYCGIGFSVSPSGRRIAWAYPEGGPEAYTAFVNDVMVFPVCAGKFVLGDLLDMRQVGTNKLPSQVITEEDLKNVISERPRWKDDSTLLIVTDEFQTSKTIISTPVRRVEHELKLGHDCCPLVSITHRPLPPQKPRWEK